MCPFAERQLGWERHNTTRASERQEEIVSRVGYQWRCIGMKKAGKRRRQEEREKKWRKEETETAYGNERNGRKEGRKFKGGTLSSLPRERRFLEDPLSSSLLREIAAPFSSLCFVFTVSPSIYFFPLPLSPSLFLSRTRIHLPPPRRGSRRRSWKRRFEISSSYRGIISAAGNKQP